MSLTFGFSVNNPLDVKNPLDERRCEKSTELLGLSYFFFSDFFARCFFAAFMLSTRFG